MDVGDWLRGLGLSRYETLFRQYDVDARSSERADGRRPRKSWRVPVNRKRLLKAIAALLARPSAPVVSPPPTPYRPGCRGAPPTHSNVLRSRRFHCDVGEARSRRYAGDDPCLSGRQFGRGRALRLFRRQVHGRRHARLFRLSAPTRTTPSGRCGQDWTSRARWPSSKHPRRRRCRSALASRPAPSWLATRRTWACARAGCRRRHPPSGGALAGARRAQKRCGRRDDQAPVGRELRPAAAWAAMLKGLETPVPAWRIMREAEHVSRFEASRSAGSPVRRPARRDRAGAASPLRRTAGRRRFARLLYRSSRRRAHAGSRSRRPSGAPARGRAARAKRRRGASRAIGILAGWL